MQICPCHDARTPTITGDLNVGCVCAEKMEDDYVGPRRREKRPSLGRGTQETVAQPKVENFDAWQFLYNYTDGHSICTIYPNGDGTWSGRIEDRGTARGINSRECYPTEGTRQTYAVFDGMVFLKNKRGWGNR